MSAYKRLNKQDAYITSYTAKKSWRVSGSMLAEMGIEQYQATGSLLSSLQQLYYPSKTAGIIDSHSYDYYLQTTLDFPEARVLTTGSLIFSIPRELVGSHLDKGYGMELNIRTSPYVKVDYWQQDYVKEVTYLPSLSLRDDGEGNLYLPGSTPRRYLGDIIYTHGIVVLTDREYIDFLNREAINYLEWKSNHDIFTHTYNCRVRESDFNSTYNPTSLNNVNRVTYDNEGNVYSEGSNFTDGTVKNSLTGSEFQPYITTVGLYNDTNELIAVGKLAQPVPKSRDTEMVLTVKIDI